MVEYHRGLDRLDSILSENGYEVEIVEKSRTVGLIYAEKDV